MKRNDLIRHLEQHGCELHREGSNHTIHINRKAIRSSVVPRHREVNDFLARKICFGFERGSIRLPKRYQKTLSVKSTAYTSAALLSAIPRGKNEAGECGFEFTVIKQFRSRPLSAKREMLARPQVTQESGATPAKQRARHKTGLEEWLRFFESPKWVRICE